MCSVRTASRTISACTAFTCASATSGVTPGARRPRAIQLKLSAVDWRSSSVNGRGPVDVDSIRKGGQRAELIVLRQGEVARQDADDRVGPIVEHDRASDR
jgi:hypothetical protein